jgi:predicted DNA-binding protein
MANKETKLLNTRIPIEVHNRLEKQMEIEERNKTVIVKNALLKYFEAYEKQEK